MYMNNRYRIRKRYRDPKEALEHAYLLNSWGDFKTAQELLEMIIRHVVREEKEEPDGQAQKSQN